MKRTFTLLLMMLILCGCNSSETNRPLSEPESSTSVAVVTDVPETTATSTTSPTVSDVVAPPIDTDIPERPDIEANKLFGARHVPLYEQSWGEYTVVFMGDYAHYKDGELFAHKLELSLLKNGEETGKDLFHLNARHISQSAYPLDKEQLSLYLKVYDMGEYPLIATMYGSDSQGYSTTFYTIPTEGEYADRLYWIYSILPADLCDSDSSIGMILSGDFSVDGNSLTDNKLGIRFTFDLATATVAAEKA